MGSLTAEMASMPPEHPQMTDQTPTNRTPADRTPADRTPADHDPNRFTTSFAQVNGIRLAYVRVGAGNPCALLCVHGWPETKRIWWRVIEPLAAAGFDVIVPDLRGFGESDPGLLGDTTTCAADLAELMEQLGFATYVVAGGDFGGPVIQELALRENTAVERMVLFNSPLPLDPLSRARWKAAGLQTRPLAGTTDYFLRQGTDADALAAELATPGERCRYIATFYSSRLWAHPGAFSPDDISFHVAPFANATVLRSSFRPYEANFDATKRALTSNLGPNPTTETLILFGTSDHVLYPDFDRMAIQVFDRHVGPFLLRDCGHFVPWESPHAFTSATISFCRDLLTATS
jgi:pimeloyl-ACP methyl ester carboxylesterase